MAERDIGREILDGLREIKAHKEGNVDLRKRTFQPPHPPKRFAHNCRYRRPPLPG
jgi:hypothetical protein